MHQHVDTHFTAQDTKSVLQSPYGAAVWAIAVVLFELDVSPQQAAHYASILSAAEDFEPAVNLVLRKQMQLQVGVSTLCSNILTPLTLRTNTSSFRSWSARETT
jgi:hypothetical protein